VVWPYARVEVGARGWAAAMTDEWRVEVRETGRGERSRAHTILIWGWVTPPAWFRIVREDTA